MAKNFDNLNTSSKGIECLLIGGTQNDLDNNRTVNSISYGLNNDIVFKLSIKDGYFICWTLYKYDAKNNLYKDEKVAEKEMYYGLAKTVISNESCDYSFNDNTFVLTTRMFNPGVVSLFIEVFGEDKSKAVKSLYLTAAADDGNIVQSLEKGFQRKKLMDATKACNGSILCS